MKLNTVDIRPAVLSDCKDILDIYSHYVLQTAITFEYEVPDVSEMQQRMNTILERYPYLVAIENHRIIGYAYASVFRSKAAYQWSPESTIYMANDQKGRGIGKKLYTKLFECLKAQGYCNVFAGVALPNDASEKLHSSCGFRELGTYENIGYKLGRWHSTRWFQLALRSEPTEPQPILSLDQIDVNSILNH